MSRKVQATYTADEVKNAFKVFEGNSPPGMIELEDLKRALSVYGSDRLTAEQVHDLVGMIDTNQNNMFNYKDYGRQTHTYAHNTQSLTPHHNSGGGIVGSASARGVDFALATVSHLSASCWSRLCA